MTRIAQMGLGASLLIVTACSPACTPPDAANPETSNRSGKDGGKPQASSPAPAPKDMIMEAKGVDLSKLSESQRIAFFQIINTEPSACGKAHSMATSLRDDATCRDSLIAAQFVADRLASGAQTSVVRDALQTVVESLKPREIDVAGRPTYGSDRAPVTVVVFADFQCPHCKAEAPALRKAVDQFRGRANLVFKHYPLGGHPRAKAAAIACEAAHEQGKFWEMHDIVFAHQNELSDDNLQTYAREIGLDMAKFQASYSESRGKSLVEKDRKDGDKLNIQGTPAVFVDGREVNALLFGGQVTGWIDDALKR